MANHGGIDICEGEAKFIEVVDRRLHLHFGHAELEVVLVVSHVGQDSDLIKSSSLAHLHSLCDNLLS